MPTTIITIDGTDYGTADRAANRFNAIEELTLDFDDSTDRVAFTLVGIGPIPIFSNGQEVIVTVDGTDYLTGNVIDVHSVQSNYGWTAAFSATGLKGRANRVTITAADGSGEAVYNRSPDDPDYISSDSGLSVGDILTRVLQISDNATALAALGIGGYTGTTLPSVTTTDFAALTVVPPQEVALLGEGLFSELKQFVSRWCPKFSLWIQSDGKIRCIDLFSMPPQTLTVPGDGTADPVMWPNFKRSSDSCYTKLTIKGRDIQPAILSVVDDTLDYGWTPTEQSNWRYSDFIQPKDATDEGAITSLSSTSATIDPDDATHAWTTNFWTPSNRAGWIQLFWTTGTGIDIFESRPITACGSLSAGGTTTITWDSSLPLSHTNYDRYRIVGKAGGLVDVGRLFLVKEPSSGATGLSTFVGSHLVKRFPLPVPWSNNGKSFNTTTPVAVAQWSRDGVAPYIEWPVTLEVVPSLGAIRLTEPIFTATASPPLNSDSTYPPDYLRGLPIDLRVMVPYNRGTLNATVPSSGYEGTGHTTCGIQREKVIHLDSWTWAGDTANMLALAQEHLDVLKDEVIEGSITYLGWPGFDPLTLGYSLNIAIQGASGPLDGIDLPVRSVTVRWPQDGATTHTVTFNFSNQRRPFSGDSLYVHPAFASGGQGGGQSGAMITLADPGVFNMTAPVVGQQDGPGFMPNFAPPSSFGGPSGANKKSPMANGDTSPITTDWANTDDMMADFQAWSEGGGK